MKYELVNILNRPLIFTLRDNTTLRLNSFGSEGHTKELDDSLFTPEVENSNFLRITAVEDVKEEKFEKKNIDKK